MSLRQHDAGFSLIATTWMVLLLALISVSVLTLALGVRRDASTLTENLEETYLAESTLEIFLHRYFYNEKELVYSNGVVSIPPHSIDVEVVFDAGLININRAEATLLSAMFAARGVAEDKAKSLAAAIIDWRDTDSDVSADGGAEFDEYQVEGLAGPRNGYFHTVSELQYVMGMTLTLYSCVLDVVTVTGPARQFPDLGLALDGVKEIVEWGFVNEWEDFEWPDVETYEDKEGVAGSSDDLAGETATLYLTIDGDPNKAYFTGVRFGSTGGGHVAFRKLTPLREFWEDKGETTCDS